MVLDDAIVCDVLILVLLECIVTELSNKYGATFPILILVLVE